MGTSASSKGPGPNVPIVPPWVEDPTAPPAPPNAPPPAPPPLAQPRRFRPARTALGRWSREGSEENLRRGLGHYTRSGMGGAANATSRMAGSASSAGAIYEALTALAANQPLPPQYGIQQGQISGLSQAEIIDALVDALCPVDGTQDAEASRDSAARALCEIVDEGGDVTDLSQDQIDWVVQTFLGNEIAHRIALDVGMAVLDKAPSAKMGQQRLEEMQAYVREELARRYGERRALHGSLDRQSAAQLGRDVIHDTFDIFESYL